MTGRVPATLTLSEVAERLGVHYMTAYRYVRTGRLPATRVGQHWVVKRADLSAFERAQQRAPVRGRRRSSYPAELRDRLLHGDESDAWAVVERALSSGMESDAVLLELLGPALAEIGDGWEAGSLTVADEHRASAVALRLIGRLGPTFARRGRKRALVVVGAVPGDQHGLPTAIVRDLLRGRGLAVTDLGADVPADSWAFAVGEAAAASPVLAAVGLCATTADNDTAIAEAIAAVRSVAEVPVVVGGHGVASEDHARRLGADRFSESAGEAAAVLASLASASKPS